MKGNKIILILLLVIAGCSNLTENKIIARVGNRPVYVKDFKDYVYKNTKPAQFLNITEADLQKQLQIVIDNKRKLTEAYENNLDNDSTIISKVDQTFKNVLHNYVITKNVVDPVIPEQEYRTRYDRMSREVKGRHIFIPASKDSIKNLQSVKILDSLKSEIIKGADFELLARKFSQDSLTAGKGGNLGFVKWPVQEWGIEFSNELFSLSKGEVSPVITTQKGYHILNLVEDRSISVVPYDYMREMIQKGFFREKARQLSQTYQEWIKKLEADYHMQMVDENIDYFCETTQKLIKNHDDDNFDFDIQRVKDQFDTTRVMVKYDSGVYTLDQYFNDIKNMFIDSTPSHFERDKVLNTLETLVIRQLIPKYALDNKYQLKRELKEQKQNIKHKYMIDLLETKCVDEQIPDSEYKKYYDENINEYNNISRYHVQEILVSNKKLAESLYEQIKNGADFGELAKRYTERKEYLRTTGDLGMISDKHFGIVGKTASTMKKGELSKPVKNGNAYSIIKLDDLEEGGKVKWENLVPYAKIKVQNKYATEKRKEWREKLDNKYKVVIYEKELKPFII